MKRILLAVFLTLLTFPAYAKVMTLREIGLACVRVNAGFAWGSGCVVAETEDKTGYYIITNKHVIGNNKSVYVEFFKYGYVSQKIPASVVLTRYQRGMSVDLAILRVNKSNLGGYKPNIIPLAPMGYSRYLDGYLATAGCPQARHLTFQEGHILRKERGLIMFYPKPQSGQSGSPIVANIIGKDGKYYTRYVGLLTWSMGGDGGAQSSDLIYHALGQAGYEFGPVKLPMGFRELSFNKPNEVDFPDMVPVSQPTGEYARCSNGKLYPVYIKPDGNKSVVHPFGTRIVEWGLDANGNKIGSFNSGPGCGPISPYSPSPSQPSQPFGGPFSPQQPPQQSPFGDAPPSIGSPWPGSDPTTNQPSDDSDDAENVSFITKLFGDTFSSGLFTGGIIGLLAFIWSRFIKSKVIKQVDSLEDYVEQKVKKQWGPEMAKEARDAMEGIEDVLLDLVDDVLNSIKAEKKVVKGKLKNEIKTRLNGGIGLRGVGVHEVMRAVEEAAKEVGDDTVTTEVPKRVKEILKAAKG